MWGGTRASPPMIPPSSISLIPSGIYTACVPGRPPLHPCPGQRPNRAHHFSSRAADLQKMDSGRPGWSTPRWSQESSTETGSPHRKSRNAALGSIIFYEIQRMTYAVEIMYDEIHFNCIYLLILFSVPGKPIGRYVFSPDLVANNP